MDPITAFFVNLIVGVLLSAASTLLQQALRGPQKAPGPNGQRGQVQTGGQVPQSFLIGTIGSAGKLEYESAWGNDDETPNAYLVEVLSFGDITISASVPDAMWVNTQPVTVAASGHVTQGYPVAEFNDGSDHAWWEFIDGTQTGAPSYLTGKFGSDPDRPWLSDMIGRGLPILTATALVSDSLWTGSPTVVAQWQGIPLYDPRKDTTAGGSGSHRWGTRSTYEFSDNNAVIIYNILRGVFDDAGNHVWGGSATAYQLPYDVWAAAMDACDENVDLVGGGTEKRFRGGREIFLNERPADVIQEFLTGANARIAWSAGQWFILVGLPDSADGSFTDADVLASESVTQTPFPNLDEVINGGTGSYMEPAQAWEFKETAPYYRSDLEAEDDDRRNLVDIKLSTTFSGTQAQRVLKATVEEGRRFLKWAVALTPAFAAYRPLQVLAWTSAAEQYDAKLFLIIGRTVDPWGRVYLGLQEIDPADHDWTAADDEQPLSFAPLTAVVPGPQLIADWAVTPASMANPDAVGWFPTVRVAFRGQLPDIRAVLVEIRESWGSKNVVFSAQVAYDIAVASPSWIVPAPLLPNTLYEVRGRYLPISARITRWSNQDADGVDGDWFSVTTPNVSVLPPESIALASLGRDIVQWVGGVSGTVRQLIEQFKGLGTTLDAADQSHYEAREALSRSLDVRLGDNEASFNEIIEVAVSPTGAIGLALQSLYAAMGDNTSQVNVRWSSVAADTGYSARYAVQAAVDDGDFRSASLFLDVPSDSGQPTRIGLSAGQTVFFTSDGTPIAAIDEDGIFGSTNGVVQLNMLDGTFSITVP